MALVGRNDPCPCGSGKKYKKCCADAGLARPAPNGLKATSATKATNAGERSLLHELDGRVVEEIMLWARGRYGAAYSPFTAFPYEFDASGPDVDLFAPWSAYEYFVDEDRVIDRYLAERGRSLSPQNREWLSAQARAWVSAWEVKLVQPGEGIRARDMLTGEARFIREIKGSRQLAVGDVLLGRVVDFRGGSIFCGTHPRKLSSGPAEAFVRAAAGALSIAAAPEEARKRDGLTLSVGRLRQADASRIVIRLWKDATDGALQ